MQEKVKIERLLEPGTYIGGWCRSCLENMVRKEENTSSNVFVCPICKGEVDFDKEE